MPRRTNTFQKLIHLIPKQLTNCEVVESALLLDRRSGEMREVDIAIRTEVAGYPVLVGIECRDHRRPQSSGWIEEMWAKHQALPTSSLILVSASGFYKPARRVAAALGVELLSLDEATAADWPKNIPTLRRIQMLQVWRSPVRITVVPEQPWSLDNLKQSDLATALLYGSDGVPIGSIQEFVESHIKQIQLERTHDGPMETDQAICDATMHIRFEAGAYAEIAGQRVGLREILALIRVEAHHEVANPKMMRFRNLVMLRGISESKNADIVFNLLANEETSQLSIGASIVELKHRHPACIWDVAVPIEYCQNKPFGMSKLDYLNPSQFKTDGEPCLDPPKLIVEFRLREHQGTPNLKGEEDEGHR